MIIGIDHVQLAMPGGGEDQARAFYVGLLGMAEVTNPEALAARGGCWFELGPVKLHLGVEEDFRAARKAHPGLLVDDSMCCQRRCDRWATMLLTICCCRASAAPMSVTRSATASN